jgi:LmbE family N-acetylglucosaminyl deacetylase
MGDLGVVLGVWAHPDDETYLSAIHMARAAAAGQRVACITATRGELGSTDEARWPPGPELASVRTVELERAFDILGVGEHQWLDYPDGGCADVPVAEGAALVRSWIDRVHPDTILTFGPDGMTGHSDHQSVSGWVDAAVATCTANRPDVLWATNTPEWLAKFRPRLDELNVYMGAEPPCTPKADLRSHIQLSPEERDLKVAALLCQISQVEPLVAAFGEDFLHEGMSEESFR